MIQLDLDTETRTYEIDGIDDHHRWITQKRLAELLNVSEMTVFRWAKKGVIPKPKKFGEFKNAAVRYDVVELAKEGIFCRLTKNLTLKSATIVDGEKKLLVFE